MRDPRDVLKGKVEGRVNAKIYGAESAAKQKARKAVSGAAQSAGKKKKKMGWWPFGGKKDAAEAPTCGGCGKEVDATWEICPYCRTPLVDEGPPAAPPPGGPPLPNAPPGAGGPPVVAGNKTVAIDIEKIKPPRRELVGWLVVMAGNQKGQDFRIYAGKNSLGAAADNDIVITDDYLSSRHATIRYEDSRYEIIDNDSTNGTFVNEKRVTKEELIDNDTLRVGRTELRFKALY